MIPMYDNNYDPEVGARRPVPSVLSRCLGSYHMDKGFLESRNERLGRDWVSILPFLIKDEIPGLVLLFYFILLFCRKIDGLWKNLRM